MSHRGFQCSLQKRFATPALRTLQGHGILQRFIQKTLQNTCTVMPARDAPATTELKGVETEKAAKTPVPLADKAPAPLSENAFSRGLNQINSPSSGSILGIFENKAMSVEEIEGKVTYPVKIIGTRKPFRFWFFEWDFNAVFIRDM